MNVYDFDGTILDGDTEEYFFLFLSKKNIFSDSKAEYLKTLLKARLDIVEKYDEYSNEIYKTLFENIENLDDLIEEFWDLHLKYIKDFYFVKRKPDDVITTATPAFLVEPIFKELQIKNFIAPKFDLEKMCFTKNLNYGSDKVPNFLEVYGENCIDEFYSDSDSDIELAKLAKKPIKVIGEKFTDWIIK